MLQRLMLSLSRNQAVARLVGRRGMRAGWVRRFVAGENVQDAVSVVRDLNAREIQASLDFLGEGVRDAAEARAASREYIEVLDAIHAAALHSSISVKLTQLGLDVDAGIAEENVRQVIARALRFSNFVRIDMESSAYTERTLRMFERLHREFGNGVGVVIQSYLRRSPADVAALLPLKPNVRLCKGAYNEPSDVAFASKSQVDRSYMALLETLLRGAGYTAVATHDERIIRHAIGFAQAACIPRAAFEFEMLYGVRRDLQMELAQQGYSVRVYVPFGRQWYPYFMRRMAERPANLWFVLQNLVRP